MTNTTTPLQEIFGYIIAAHRIRANMTEAALVERMNEKPFTPVTVDDFKAWKRAESAPDAGTLEAIIDILLKDSPNKEIIAKGFRESADALACAIEKKDIENYLFDDKNLGSHINMFRNVRGISEEALVDAINREREYVPISEFDLLDYQFNAKRPNRSTMARMADALELTGKKREEFYQNRLDAETQPEVMEARFSELRGELAVIFKEHHVKFPTFDLSYKRGFSRNVIDTITSVLYDAKIVAENPEKRTPEQVALMEELMPVIEAFGALADDYQWRQGKLSRDVPVKGGL